MCRKIRRLHISLHLSLIHLFTKYAVVYFSGQANAAAQDNYFTSFITSPVSPVVFALFFMAVTALVVYNGVEDGSEKVSGFMMPVPVSYTHLRKTRWLARKHSETMKLGCVADTSYIFTSRTPRSANLDARMFAAFSVFP